MGNLLLRESLEIYFSQGHGFVVYFYLLIILAPVEFLSLYLPSLDAQMWSGSASLFKVCALTALLLTLYFAVRVANQEFVSWKFLPLQRWTGDNGQSIQAVARGQLAFLSLHSGFSLLLCVPFLIWAAAIARTALSVVAVTLCLLFFYMLVYSVWGLFALALWERRAETRQVFVRCFLFALFVASALVYLPLNPAAFLLAYLSGEQLAPLGLLGTRWPATGVHFTAHLLLGGAGVAAHRWALRRELST
jgi:hypothetical protein